MTILKKNLVPTNTVADTLGVKSNTIRRSLCVRGHYMGIVPRKLPNGRLLWPAEELEKVINGTAER